MQQYQKIKDNVISLARCCAAFLSLHRGWGTRERQEWGGRGRHGWTDAGVIIEAKHCKVVAFFFKANYAHLCFKKEEVALVLKRVVGASETQVAADVTRHLSAPLTPSACNHSDANTSSTVSSRQVAHRHKYVIFAIKQMTHRIYNDINRRCFSSLNWVG